MWDSGEMFTDLNGNMYCDWGAGEWRLYALRELMRLEMPSSKADVVVGPPQFPALPGPVPPGYALQALSSRPALSKNYLRRAASITGGLAAWTEQFEGAECLYLIVAAMRDGEDSALDFFAPQEIGDFDADGMFEIHDAWGNPIEFVRWPAGYSEHPGPDGAWGVAGVDDDPDGPTGSEQPDGIVDNSVEAGAPFSDDVLPPPTPQTRNSKKAPDPFDPLKVDGRYRLPNIFITPFALKPLIYSPGPDKEYRVHKISPPRFTGGQFQELPDATSRQLLDPYRVIFNPAAGDPPRLSAGSCYDPLGAAGFVDNITNHDFSEK
jgi:hypothetical protein